MDENLGGTHKSRVCSDCTLYFNNENDALHSCFLTDIVTYNGDVTDFTDK